MTKPVEMRVEDGIVVPGFPAVKHIGVFESPDAIRSAELVLILHNLDEADSALALLGGLKETAAMGEGAIDGPLMRALSVGATVAYCRCFDNEPSLTHLFAPDVFAGNANALAAHEYIFELRSKHHAHDLNDRRQSTVSAAFDAEGEFLTLTKHQTITDESDDLVNDGRLLIRDARTYVEAEITRVDAALEGAIRALTPAERLALPSPIYRPALTTTIKRIRRQSVPRSRK